MDFKNLSALLLYYRYLSSSKIYVDISAIKRPTAISSTYRLGTNKKDLDEVNFNGLVDHLEKSSPLIFAEIERWRYLLRDDYIYWKSNKNGRKKLSIP